METVSAYSLTTPDWKQLVQAEGRSPNLLPFLLDGLYKDQRIWDDHVSKSFLGSFLSKYDLDLPSISKLLEAQDGTVKFQVRFKDGLEVETVLIPFRKRFTVCLSTQVGCAMNCSFCYTGTQGLKRNLRSHEIVGQYLLAYRWLRERDPRALKPSLVFMGQGEPLHNVDEVLRAVEIFGDRGLLDLGRRQMTLSTVGFLPGLRRLKDFPKINLALSLHSPFDDQRSELIPVNERFPLAEVLRALDEVRGPREILTVEYLVIRNFNMSARHAEALSELLRDRRCVLNLIPFNPFPGSRWERPSREEVDQFKHELVSRNLRVLVRTTKGDDILAACGQLKINKLARSHGT